MRLKKDKSSWRSSGIIKRDFKHGNVPIPERSHTKSHKDTKRWCGGRPGREHQLKKIQKPLYSWTHDNYFGAYTIVICEKCKKEFYVWKKQKKYADMSLHIYVSPDYNWYRIPCRLSDGSYKDLVQPESYF